MYEVFASSPEVVVEVGVGSGFLRDYLRKRGVEVVGVDVNEALSPDVVGDVTALPLATGTADVVVAFEVLEHIPFEKLEVALEEMARVTKKYVIISLPHLRNYTYYKLPRLGVVVVPTLRHRWRKLPPEHLWELDLPPATVENVKAKAKKVGLSTERDYHIPEHPYHHIFRFRKQGR